MQTCFVDEPGENKMSNEKGLEDLALLTKRYAAYGADRGGLVGVLGGGLLIGTSVLGTWWSAQHVAVSPLAWAMLMVNSDPRRHLVCPLWLTFVVWVTPFLFLGGGAWLRNGLYLRFGRVKALEPRPQPPTPRAFILWGGLLAVVLTLVLAMVFGLFPGENTMALRLLGECCLGAAFVGAVRIRKPRGDELGLLLFLWLNAGFASVGTLWLWVPLSWMLSLFGLILAIRGLFQHFDFLELRKEL